MISDYENFEDIKKMQQEAVKRVQEMQKKAKISLEYSNSGINNKEITIQDALQQKIVDQPSRTLSTGSNNKNTLDTLINDPQKSLILLLILLLYDEKSDLMLILALFYIML